MSANDNKNHRYSLSTALAAGVTAFGLVSLPATSQAEEWQFSISPYDKADSGFMAMFSARKGKWIFGFDGSYFKLSDGQSKSVEGPFGRESAKGAIELTNRQWIYQPMVGYLVLDDRVKVDIYGGARYTRLRVNMDIDISTSVDAFPGGDTTFRGELEWTDFVLGGHFSMPLGKKFSVDGLVDAGTGEYSDMSYQLLGVGTWHFSETMSASLGYRLLVQNYEEDAFEYDAKFNGLMLGMTFNL